MQSGDTYRSTGSGWTKISGTDNHSGQGIVQHTHYSWATDRLAFVDGAGSSHPVRIEASGTYTILTNAPTGQKFIKEFSGYLWMSSGNSTLTYSAPQNDNDYNAGDGAGTINVGFNIVGLGVWRGALYVFGTNKIAQVTGTSSAEIQRLTAGQNDVRLVSLTVDPRTDTPPVLAKFGARCGLDTNRWFMLTGDKATLHGIIGTSFLARDTGDPFNSMPGNFTGTERIAVVDQHGRVRVYFYGLRPETAAAVVAEIAELRKNE